MGKRTIIRRPTFILLVLFCTVSSAVAGRVFFEKLEEMIGRVDAIVIGTIITAERPKTAPVESFRYSVAVTKNLVGDPGEKTLEFSYHCCPSTGDGKIRFSPIVRGWSGIEGSLTNGAAYLFLLEIRKDGSDANVSVLRVEPLAKRELVIATWQAGRQEQRDSRKE